MSRIPSDFPDPVERGYWHDVPPPIPRRESVPSMDAPIPIVPTNRREPVSEPGNNQIVLNANCPPWNCPPFWATSFDVNECACIPLARKDTVVYRFKVPQDRMLIIKGISYEIHGINQYESFNLKVMDDGMSRFTVEDMLIDPTSANPAHRYAFSGHTRQMPVHTFIDHNHTLVVTASFLGVLDLAGKSSVNEGDILVTNPKFCINIRGWLANVRDGRDGGPRPTDLGNLLHIPLTDDWRQGGYPVWP